MAKKATIPDHIKLKKRIDQLKQKHPEKLASINSLFDLLQCPNTLPFFKTILETLKYYKASLQLNKFQTMEPLNEISSTAEWLLHHLGDHFNNANFSTKQLLSSIKTTNPTKRQSTFSKKVNSMFRGHFKSSPFYTLLLYPIVISEDKDLLAAESNQKLLQAVILNLALHHWPRIKDKIDFYELTKSLRLIAQVANTTFSQNITIDDDPESMSSNFSNLATSTTAEKEYIRAIKSFFKKIANLDKTTETSGKKRSRKLTGKSRKYYNLYGWISLSESSLILMEVDDPEQDTIISVRERFIKDEDSDDTDETYTDEYVLDEISCDNATLDVVIGSGKAQAKHLKFANQRLYPDLTASEVSKLIDTCRNLAKDDKPKTSYEHLYRASIFVIISLLVGYNLKKAAKLRLLKPGQRPRHASFVQLSHDFSQLYIPVPVYHRTLRVEDAPDQGVFEQTEPFLTLDVPYFLGLIIHQILKLYQSIPKKTALEKAKLSRTLDDAYSKLIRMSGIDNGITKINIQDHAFNKILKNANGDLWIAGVISGRDDLMANTQKHYTTLSIEKLQSIYQKSVCETFALPADVFTPIETNLAQNKIKIGDAYRPKRRAVKSHFKQLNTCLKHYANAPLKTLNTADLIYCINLYAVFIDSWIAFTCATRNVKDPYIHPKLITRSRIAKLNDKNRFDGYNTRTVVITKALKDALLEYESFKYRATKILKERRLLILTSIRNHGLLVLQQPLNKKSKQHVEATVYTRSKVSAYLNPKDLKALTYFSKLKSNSNRHYLRSMLLENKTNPEFIDAYMGHWHSGAEPWSIAGIFDPLTYYKEMKMQIEVIENQLKIEVPFFES